MKEKLIHILKSMISANIPVAYAIPYLTNKLIMLIYGWGLFRRKYVFIHHSSIIKCKSRIYISGKLVIDRNCYIDALAKEGVSFGDTVALGMNTVIQCSSSIDAIGKGLKVGGHTTLGTHGFYGCAGGITVGKNVLIGNYVSMHSENHLYKDSTRTIREQGVSHQGIIIGDDCWIGSKVTILDGTRIGDGCVVAAGAVVRGNIPPYSVIGGIPARILKKRELDA